MEPITDLVHKYLRHDKKFPTVWCPGCGNGIILGSMMRAIDTLGWDKNNVVLVAGIGCAGRLPVYCDFNTLHTTHGRALTFATGIKLARPELNVVVVMGDGDSTAIGGNHFIHAARRNIDLTAIIFNNSVYGMTGGQYSPTSPYGAKATTAPYGNLEQSFNISRLAEAAGATFVARGTAYHAKMLDGLIGKALTKKGFSVVEVIVHCHTYYGRQNKFTSPVEMLFWQKEKAVRIEKAREMSPDELGDRFPVGVLVDRDIPTYEEGYKKVRETAGEAIREIMEEEKAKEKAKSRIYEEL
ncbi:MAG TPA: 2-oxoacid:ferredoxin oxidoreductase subunit beta [Nitrospiria bacterium]|nr:2-oxoacid:ferredoxin oxidoreductase subunit beta [Nitrospiria bacterium]